MSCCDRRTNSVDRGDLLTILAILSPGSRFGDKLVTSAVVCIESPPRKTDT